MGFKGATTRIRVAGSEDWLTGDVEITPGVGALLSQSDGGMQLDVALPSNAQPFGLFIPGELAAQTVAIITNPADAALLHQLEANLLTPTPVGTDGTDHYAVRVLGDEGQQDLALDTAEESRFSWDALGEIELASMRAVWADNSFAGRAHVTHFRPTGDLNVTALGFYAGSGGTSLGWRAFILDNAYPARTRLRQSARDASAWAAGDERIFPLETAITLEQGADYWLGFESVNADGSAHPGGMHVYRQDQYDWDGSGDQADIKPAGHPSPGSITAFRGWTHFGGGAGNATPELIPWDDGIAGVFMQGNTPRAAVYGSAGAVLLTGNIVVEIAAEGSPPAGGPGDVNLRFSLASEE